MSGRALLLGGGLLLAVGCATPQDVPRNTVNWGVPAAPSLTPAQKLLLLQLAIQYRAQQAPSAIYADVYLSAYCQARGGVYTGGQCYGQGPAVPAPTFGGFCTSRANIYGGFDTNCQ